MPEQRKCEFRLYPTNKQEAALAGQADVCREVYNWGLASRRWFYSEWKITRGFADQCRDLTEARASRPSWQSVHTHALQGALKRLDLAFKHFFRRCKLGETPGFPRFKSKEWFSGFGYKEHGNGWRMDHAAKRVKLAGIGRVKIRGHARFPLAQPTTCEVVKRAGKWYLSVTYTVESLPKLERTAVHVSGLDWGLETFATIANGDGSDEAVANPRHLRRKLGELRSRQRALSRAVRGSKRREKLKSSVASLHAKIANQRRDFLHKQTTRLARSRKVIAVEILSPKAMSSHGGARKRGLNREILAASAGMFHSMLACKAKEAGCAIVEVDPRKHKPSQTDSVSGEQRKKKLSDRSHTLPDGTVISRDLNAARNLLKFALAHARASAGESPAGGLGAGSAAPLDSAKPRSYGHAA